MTIREELEKATGLTINEGEEAAAYRQRLIEACDGLADEVWKELSPAAQTQINATIDAIEKKTAIPEFADEAKAAEPAPAAKADKAAEKAAKEAAKAAEKEAKAAEKEAAKAAKAAEKEAAKAAKPEKVKEPKKPSLMSRGRELVCQNPDITLEAFKETLVKEGFVGKDITFNIIINETKAVIAELRKAGQMK